MDNLCPDGAYYIFDIDVLNSRLEKLKSMLPENAALCYAVKANTFIVPYLIKSIEKFEICSSGEMRICASMGVPNGKCVISGINKDFDAIENAVINDGSQMFTAESPRQAEMLSAIAEKYGKRLNVLLRLTNGSQFGMDKCDIAALLEAPPARLDIKGIQYFSGTQKSSVKKYIREIEKLNEFLNTLKEAYGFTAEELEYGTGLPVEYFVDESFCEEKLTSELSAALQRLDIKPRITLEIGRSIAAHCGTYYTHVVDLKRNKGVNYAVCDGGMNHIVYFGQSLSMRVPFVDVVGNDGERNTAYALCGSLCSMNDILVKAIDLPELSIGDTLAFKRAGAYCATEGIAMFLSRDLPSIFIKEGQRIKCVRSRIETAQFNGLMQF